MGGITGATSGKFVMMAATLLFHGRVDNAPATISIVPGAPRSALGERLGGLVARGGVVKIGIRGAYLHAPVTALEHVPAEGADLRIGQDILAANPIEIDFVHHQLRLLLAGEAARVERGMTPIRVTHRADGTLTIPLQLDGAAPVEAALDLAHATGVTSPATTAKRASIANIELKTVAITPGEAASVGMAAFAKARIIFDLGHDRVWLAT